MWRLARASTGVGIAARMTCLSLGAVLQSAALALSLLARAVPLRHHQLVSNQDRLERAAAFVAKLHRLSAKTPHSYVPLQPESAKLAASGSRLSAIRKNRPMFFCHPSCDRPLAKERQRGRASGALARRYRSGLGFQSRASFCASAI